MSVDTSIPILVVDDYTTMIRIIRNLLRQLGFIPPQPAAIARMLVNRLKGARSPAGH